MDGGDQVDSQSAKVRAEIRKLRAAPGQRTNSTSTRGSRLCCVLWGGGAQQIGQKGPGRRRPSLLGGHVTHEPPVEFLQGDSRPVATLQFAQRKGAKGFSGKTGPVELDTD